MFVLTPGERRGALLVALLLLIGAGYDLWRSHAPEAPGQVDLRAVVVGAGADSGAGRPQSGTRLDLNRATAGDLDRLPGIGPVLASRIVAQREQHGAFRSPEDLLAVPGIGPALYARLAPLVTSGTATPP